MTIGMRGRLREWQIFHVGILSEILITDVVTPLWKLVIDKIISWKIRPVDDDFPKATFTLFLQYILFLKRKKITHSGKIRTRPPIFFLLGCVNQPSFPWIQNCFVDCWMYVMKLNLFGNFTHKITHFCSDCI